MRIVKSLIGLAIVAIIVVVGGRFLVGLTGSDVSLKTIGENMARGGCASTDNCVSSYATEAPWAIGHLTCEAAPERALEVATRLLLAQPRAERGDEPGRLVMYSTTFHFPDDVVLEPSARGLEIGSASRLGAGDLGVNRRRVEDLAAAMAMDPTCRGVSDDG